MKEGEVHDETSDCHYRSANVGKSTIFNRIVGESISIVEDIPGVTRDRIFSSGEWLTMNLTLSITGAIDLGDETFLRANSSAS